jgi:stress-induced morphogen
VIRPDGVGHAHLLGLRLRRRRHRLGFQRAGRHRRDRRRTSLIGLAVVIVHGLEQGDQADSGKNEHAERREPGPRVTPPGSAWGRRGPGALLADHLGSTLVRVAGHAVVVPGVRVLNLRRYDGAVGVDTLRADLARAFPDASELSVVDRTGTGDHFQVTVATERFRGLSLVEQHKLVYDALAGPLGDGTIHELRINTR